MDSLVITPVAHIENDFSGKFGIPRQSGLVPEVISRIVFEPEYRKDAALKGIEGYSHLWLIWEFSKARRENWSPTVRPPRLGGNERMGVFATRSPFRPNPLGLSCVEFAGIEHDEKRGSILLVRGADLLDGTPIYDIKPYLPHIEAHPEALAGFAGNVAGEKLSVVIPENALRGLTPEQITAVRKILRQDPRPAYQEDPERIYGMNFAGRNIRFRVEKETLYVLEDENLQ